MIPRFTKINLIRNSVRCRELLGTLSTPTIVAGVHTKEDDVEEVPVNFLDHVEKEVKPVETNKSRLLPQHRNVLYGKVPYDEPQSWIHNTERYKRTMLGRYGLGSGVDPRICFPNKDDLKVQEEYERVKYPHTIKEMMEINRIEKDRKRLETQKREEEIATKLEKLEQWKDDLVKKIAKKEFEAKAAKERKERLVEDVRRHFGFTVDPRDDRFKEMLEKKEKEDRKKQKEAKRKAKDDKMLAKLAESAKTKEFTEN